MRKILAIIKREYLKVVFSWIFIIGTLAVPVFTLVLTVVPTMILSMNNDAIDLAVVDFSKSVSANIYRNLSDEALLKKQKEIADNLMKEGEIPQDKSMSVNAKFIIKDIQTDGKSLERIKSELNQEIREGKLDAYLIVPEDFESGIQYFARNSEDFSVNEIVKNAAYNAIQVSRFAKYNIDERTLENLNQKTSFTVTKLNNDAQEIKGKTSYTAALIIGLILYITLTFYGQSILSGVVEEKETRIAEILFSSAKPFQLIMGKLIGAGAAGLTQLTIWMLSALALTAYSLTSASLYGLSFTFPNITVSIAIYFIIFFMLGFFIYATIFALIGSIVTTAQEGSQFAFIPIFLLIIAIYSIFPVLRNPNSTFAMWVSIAPFLAPIVMPVRILNETPPFWQIALSILLNLISIIGLVWAASKIYRIGMLMYGKRATIPEILKWIKY